MHVMKNKQASGTRTHLPYNTRLKERARELRTNATPAERKLWYEFLRFCPMQWHRQKPLAHYIVDFYCSTAQLVIEIDGDSHFNESSIEYDRRRTQVLESYGLHVIRFTNLDVLKNFEGVCSKITEVLNERTP